MNKAAEDGVLEGIRICNAAPSFNHLLFADDSLVLIKATSESARTLQHILQLYETCSGQTINFDKSSIMFSSNTRNERRSQVLHELNIRSEARTEKYLGLPVYVGRSRSQTFAYLKDRIWKKIQGWQEKMLSKAAKDILIKACAQAIPTFAMSCFDLTKTLCDEISTMICRYWWAQQEKENKVHWLSWETLTKPKSDGGLGFRDLYAFNVAMLARQVWRLLDNPNSLCGRVLKARYFPNTSILEAVPMSGISYTWRSILKGVSLLKEGLVWRIGDGVQVKMWTDPWLPREGSRIPVTPRRQSLLTNINELINPITGTWDEQLVRDTFWEVDATVILKIPIREEFEDLPAWHYDDKGIFSVKTAYHLYMTVFNPHTASSSGTGESALQWKGIWDLEVVPQIKQFIWRLAHNSLPLKMNIKRRGIECNTLCVCCKKLDEDGAHLFLKCKEVKKAWELIGLHALCDRMGAFSSVASVVEEILALKNSDRILVCCMLWRWWLARNKLNSEGVHVALESVIRQARYWAAESEVYCKGVQNTGPSNGSVSRHSQWTPPMGDTLKINCDGAFFSETGTGGWGFVIRDRDGAVRGSGAGHLEQAASAAFTEAQACQEALQAAAAWGMIHLQVETDAQNLVTALKNGSLDRTPEGVIYRDIRAFIQMNFLSVSFSYCPRLCNKLAHDVAAFGVSRQDSRSLWLESLPVDVHVPVTSMFAESIV
jgi:hypothetical protein